MALLDGEGMGEEIRALIPAKGIDPAAAVGEAVRMARLMAARQAPKIKRARPGTRDQNQDQDRDTVSRIKINRKE